MNLNYLLFISMQPSNLSICSVKKDLPHFWLWTNKFTIGEYNSDILSSYILWLNSFEMRSHWRTSCSSATEFGNFRIRTASLVFLFNLFFSSINWWFYLSIFYLSFLTVYTMSSTVENKHLPQTRSLELNSILPFESSIFLILASASIF